jgi:hypothetical protein
MTLADYKTLVLGKTCRWCSASLTELPIQHYTHEGGHEVESFEMPQWLYVTCPKCDYQWSLWKLGITGDKQHPTP